MLLEMGSLDGNRMTPSLGGKHEERLYDEDRDLL